MDVRPGGLWRFINRDADGTRYAFKGIFHDVVMPQRDIFTFEFKALPGHVALMTAIFEEIDGKTKYAGVSVFQSI